MNVIDVANQLLEYMQSKGADEMAAEAAVIRFIFMTSAEEYGRLLTGRQGKLPPNYTISAEDAAIVKIWSNLYIAMKDSEVGRDLLSHIAQQNDRIKLLEEENARLLGAAIPRPDNLKTDFRSEHEGICVRCRQSLREAMVPDPECWEKYG